MRVAIASAGATPRVQWLSRVLCVLGVGVAGYLAWSYQADVEPFCGPSGGCADVQNSAYSSVAGVPVPVIGVTGYLVLLALSLLRGRLGPEMDFYLPVLIFGAALIGVLYSAYLTYLEAFVIRAWCYWCLASAGIMVAVWVLSVVDLRKAWTQG